MTSVASSYPASLPQPSSILLMPNERRVSSDVLGGPQQTRGVQRDYLSSETVQWDNLTSVDAKNFDDWWNLSLMTGGAWFVSSWPSPQGFIPLVRRFKGALKWSHVPGGFWKISADVLVRGVGISPNLVTTACQQAVNAAAIAQSEIALVYQYAFVDPLPAPITVGTYSVLGRSPGAVGPNSTFPVSFSIAWSSIPDAPAVGIFGCNRTGTGVSIMTTDIVITSAPLGAAVCKTIVVETTGSWTNNGTVSNNAVTVNGSSLGFSSFTPAMDSSPGYLTMQIVLRSEGGIITAAPY